MFTYLPPITYGLLALYMLILLYGMFGPKKEPDPQRGAAVGCLGISVLFLAALTGIYSIAVIYKISWLASGISGFCLFFVALSLINFGEWIWKKIIRK